MSIPPLFYALRSFRISVNPKKFLSLCTVILLAFNSISFARPLSENTLRQESTALHTSKGIKNEFSPYNNTLSSRPSAAGIAGDTADSVSSRKISDPLVEFKRILAIEDIDERYKQWRNMARSIKESMSNINENLLRMPDSDLQWIKQTAKVYHVELNSDSFINPEKFPYILSGISSQCDKVIDFEEFVTEEVLPEIESGLAGVRPEIVILVPSYLEGDTIGHVIEAIKEGLGLYYPGKEAVILIFGEKNVGEANLKNFFERKLFRVKTEEDRKRYSDYIENPIHHHPYKVAESFKEGLPANVHLFNFTKPGNCQGKGISLFAAMRVMDVLGADYFVTYDADLRSITPEWIKAHILPLEENGLIREGIYNKGEVEDSYDIVIPFYMRDPDDGTITNHIVYNIFAALYGKDIRQPIGGDYGLSKRSVYVIASDTSLIIDATGNFGIDNLLVSKTVAGGMHPIQANLGVKLHNDSDKDETSMILDEEVDYLGKMFLDVCGALFKEVKANFDFIESRQINDIGDIEDIALFKLPGIKEFELEPVNSHEKKIKLFKNKFGKYKPLYKDILDTDTFQELRKLSQTSLNDFYFSDLLWAKIVYAFITAYNFSDNKYSKMEMLLALMRVYQARAGSFSKELKKIEDPEEKKRVAENRIRSDSLSQFVVQRQNFVKRFGRLLRKEKEEYASEMLPLPQKQRPGFILPHIKSAA